MRTVQVEERGCGLPKEGGFYAIGGGRPKVCFALPVKLVPCSCCAQLPKFARTPSRVSHKYLQQLFYPVADVCLEGGLLNCRKCIADKVYWISWVGSDYTVESFCQEVNTMGMSRRIPPGISKLIKPGDVFANVKSGEIISLCPVESVRYYVHKKDSTEKLVDLAAAGIDVCKFEVV